MKKKIVMLFLSTLVSTSLLLSGCGEASSATTALADSAESGDATNTEESDSSVADDTEEETSSEGTVEEGELATPVDLIDTDSQFTDRDLDAGYDASNSTKITFSGSSAEASGSGVSVDGSVVTITEEGTYILSGSISDGQVIVEAPEDVKVQLVLDGVTMSCSTSACILVESADKVFITLAEGSENTLSDTGEEYVTYNDHNVTGVIYSRVDTTFNGSGSLTINANTEHGISCKEDLKFTDGTYTITSTGKGIRADESIRIKNGIFTITAEDDAIHTSKEDEIGKGYVYICGGTFTLSSGDDGIHAATALLITDGTIKVTKSYEGLEGDTIDILGGDIDVTASDDGLNAALPSSSSTMDFEDMDLDDMPEGMNHENFDPSAFMTEDGETADTDQAESSRQERMEPPTGEDGQQMEPPTGEDGQQMEPPTGEDGQQMEPPSEGTESGDAAATDSTENTQRGPGGHGGFGGGQGGGMMGGGGGMDAQENAYIRISGGTIHVSADGDGIDSNGYIYFEGGTVTVDGPTNDGNGALDCGTSILVSGGTVIAVGTSGMAESFSSDSTQYGVLYNFSTTLEAGTEITVTDESGNVILSYTAQKTYNSVAFSSQDLAAGTYTISAGDQSETITISDISTSAGTSSRMGGGMGGGNGNH